MFTLTRLTGFETLTPIKDAKLNFFKSLPLRRLDPTSVLVEDALGSVVSENVIAEGDLPSYDRSAVDGYALKAEDIIEASPFQPKTLYLTYKKTVEKGEARTIWTGNILPKGANTVVMLEHTRKIQDRIEVLVNLPLGSNVSKKGEDVKQGQILVESGVVLTPHYLGLLAALNIENVNVVKKPKVAILAVGDELVKLGQNTKEGQVVDVNSVILSNMCVEIGSEPMQLGIVKDREEEIKRKIEGALENADIVLTTGGTSIGAHDLIPYLIQKMANARIIAHGIAMRPGMPTALAVVQQKPVVILSGNPVAAVIGFEVFARPLIRRLQGVRNESRRNITAILTRSVAGVLGRRVYLRVKVIEKREKLMAEPIRTKGSGIITTLTKADGYTIIPEDRGGLNEGEVVTVHLFGP